MHIFEGPESEEPSEDVGLVQQNALGLQSMQAFMVKGNDTVENRIAVIGIIIREREAQAGAVNAILSDFGHMIVGRMGLPYRERDLSVIALIVDGTTDDIGAMTGQLGRLQGVAVRSAFTL